MAGLETALVVDVLPVNISALYVYIHTVNPIYVLCVCFLVYLYVLAWGSVCVVFVCV